MNRKTIWDPLRKKDVALTPEEHVRQWFIGVLNSTMGVPMHMMQSEVSLKFGSKPFRADILIYDRKAAPAAVVECKRPETELDGEVLNQAIRYNMVLNVKYIIITNGRRTFICMKDGDRYSFIRNIPSY
ncbi:MAG: type I restriction enzyme HsdR N-terminal domain-containing protein, partial [Bacteroidales bacterium]|nr:type I restriction enzyme HsdR N-terminal domain-containing protein [Bacteroidales bacterium]